jgi:hypothetical protein
MNHDRKPLTPISAVEALGRELDRAVHAPPRRVRVASAADWRLVLPALGAAAIAVGALTPAGAAITDRVGQLVGLADEQAALEEFCGETRACTIVNGLADPRSSDSVQVVRPGQALATDARPPSACPEAAQAYAAAGVTVDAFLGPCPDPGSIPVHPPGEIQPGEIPPPPSADSRERAGR